MSDTESKLTEGLVEVPSPKKRAKKKPSNFLVLRKIKDELKLVRVRPNDDDVEELDSTELYQVAASNGTLKSCRKKILAEKIEGELLIVCVRQRLTTSLQQELVFA